jgi:superfamily I DNA/RNA helicase
MKANAMMPDVDEASLLDLVTKYDIEFDPEARDGGVAQGMAMARDALRYNNEQLSVIDFDDMLYFAAIMNAPLDKYSHVFLDEAQDTNKVQRVLLARMTSATSRIIAVGDPFQAIYGFRGADSSAMDNIKEEFGCVTFPLSISYRCPRKVIAMAQRIVPSIEARDGAPEGQVKQLAMMELANFTALDLVLCRNVAPLITLAFRFLRAHKPVKVAGREIGEQLVSLIQKMRATSLEQLAEKLDEYTNTEVAKALSKRQEDKAERLSDQRDSVIAIIEGLPQGEDTVYDVIAVIRRLFVDDGNGGRTTLSTIHKAKGMEAHTVYILDGHLMPSKWAKQEWQMVQEQNLKYVAVTRALDSLFFIESDRVQ